jgi:hypothetical protein
VSVFNTKVKEPIDVFLDTFEYLQILDLSGSGSNRRTLVMSGCAQIHSSLWIYWQSLYLNIKRGVEDCNVCFDPEKAKGVEHVFATSSFEYFKSLISLVLAQISE